MERRSVLSCFSLYLCLLKFVCTIFQGWEGGQSLVLGGISGNTEKFRVTGEEEGELKDMYVLCTYVQFRNPNSKSSQYICTYIQDIHRQKQREREIERVIFCVCSRRRHEQIGAASRSQEVSLFVSPLGLRVQGLGFTVTV